MRRIGDKKSNTALPFDQSGDFYYRRAMKFADRDEYEKAVFNIRKAIDKDRDNVGYLLDFAGILTEIEHFDDSNDILFSALWKSGEHTAECYFGLGCNFYGLSDYKKASSSLKKYLSLSPDGEYVEDAEIMLEDIDYENIFESDDEGLGQEWKHALNEGDSKKAIEILTAFENETAEKNLMIKNNLAVAYILENEIDKALKICGDILKEDPLNIHALCNMAMIKSREGDKNLAKIYVLTALEQDEYDYSELLKISVALCDLDMHKEAAGVFYELLDENPYDLHTRHFLAIAHYNLGEYNSALSHFKFISKFKPESSVNNWYIDLVRQKMSGSTAEEYLPYTNQVSSECVYSRINKINDILKDDEIQNPWKDREFKELVLWAFDIKDDSLKSSMISLIAKYAGSEATAFFRSQLCSRHVSDDIKHRMLMNLKKMGEKEPYIALIDDNIVEVSVNTFEINATKNLDLQRKTVELIIANMPDDFDIDYFKYIINTWNKIVTNNDIFDKITDYRLWAAAFEYNYAKIKDIPSDPQEICIRYSVDMQEMLNMMDMIIKINEGR